MVKINLLNWRTEQKEKQIICFLIAAVIIFVLSSIIMVSVHIWFSSSINRQTTRNQWLQNEIDIYNKKIAEINQLKRLKEAFTARVDIIYRLQSDRFLIVKFFDHVVKMLPNGIYLSKIKRDEAQITLEGVTESNASVSQLMRSIEHISWLTNPQLKVIKKQTEKGEGFSEFNLDLWLSPKEENLEILNP